MTKKEFFQKTKRLYKTFTGPVLYNGLLLHFQQGKLINAEQATSKSRAALRVSAATITVSPKLRWAKNKVLINEFIERAERQLKDIEIL